MFEIAEMLDPASENGVQEDVFYYLDLPEYLIPNSDIIVGEGLVEPIQFKDGGNVKAVGGIYKYGEGYRFRIKFQDLVDQKDITANYQFSVKLDEKILETNSNLQHMGFGVPGALTFWIDIPKVEEPEEPVVTDYNLNVNVGWSDEKNLQLY